MDMAWTNQGVKRFNLKLQYRYSVTGVFSSPK